MDLIIIIILIVATIIIYRDVKFIAYLLTGIEVLFRVIHYIGDHIKFINLNSFIDKFFPSSLFTVADKYTSGLVYDIISWTLILAFILFIYYLVIYFIKKK